MAQNVSLMGANYPDVPAVVLPKTGGGSATFVELTGEDGKVVENGELVEQTTERYYSNGTYDTTKKRQVQISVSNSYMQSDEGKVVQNGVLVSQGAQMIDRNGTYDTTTTDEVVVNVPTGGTNKEADIVQGTLSGRYANAQVTSICDSALKNRTAMTEASFPNATTVGAYAFEGCSALERAEIDAATSVGDYSFYQLANLEEVVCPVLSEVGSYAFGYCTSLTDVDLSAVEEMRSFAFRGCSALTEAVARNCETVGGSAFRECSTLANVELPACGSFDSAAFRDCVGLSSIVLPKAGVIKDSCFYGCANLATIDLGGNYAGTIARGIGKTVFYNCSSLTALILRESTAYTLSNVSSFTGTPIHDGNGYIYVPDALKATYQGATNWSTFSSQFRSLEDYTVDGTTTGALDPTKI